MRTQGVVTTVISYPLLGFVLYQAVKITWGVVQATGGIKQIPLNLLKLVGFGVAAVVCLLFMTRLLVPLLLMFIAWMIGYVA